MKPFRMTLLMTMAIGFIVFSMPLLAQTSDGYTPAQETVCDPLKAGDVTKGLYGLCVAFCEAGDYADELDAITPEELATLEISAPSGRILANYNKKKDKANNPADPDMPCILVEESCPCWTPEELANTADGIQSATGNPAERVGCYGSTGTPSGTYNTFDETSFGANRITEQAVLWDLIHLYACQYSYRVPGELEVFTRLSIQAGTLTREQHDACTAQMIAHWDSRTQCLEGNHP